MVHASGIPSHLSRPIVSALILAAICTGGTTAADSQTLLEYSAEARFQLDFHVPDAALAAMLPAGFTPNVATQGPAKDANIRVIFVDRMTINGPDGKPVGKTGSNRLVYLAAPVKDPSGADPGGAPAYHLPPGTPPALPVTQPAGDGGGAGAAPGGAGRAPCRREPRRHRGRRAPSGRRRASTCPPRFAPPVRGSHPGGPRSRRR